ncbi:hypothetical protein [Nonomuraea sp. KM90]|uniref:hypothetical protein n=1 Tax=Nonomuraea sp. KM90 TaxID=3457428 RepID=UPI003FCC7FA6
MIEIVLGVIANVLGDYITGLLTNRQTERNRAELVTQIESQIKATQALDSKVEATALAVRELDVIVRQDKGLSWQDDRLVVRPSGLIRKTLPSPQQALDELVANITARRRELGLPLTAEEAMAKRDGGPAEGELVPPEPPAPEAPKPTPKPTSKPDLRAEVLNLPTEVLREKERRRRESGSD